MTIVIDIGCAQHGNDYSIERLLQEFRPRYLYGFDPHESVLDISSIVTTADENGTLHDTIVTTRRQAAWLYDGKIGFLSDGLNSCLSDRDDTKVTCFDLARWLYEDMPAVFIDERDLQYVVLKIDAEGSEYDLIDRLIETERDKLINLLWVEWHPFGVKNPQARRKWIEDHLDPGVDLREWLW